MKHEFIISCPNIFQFKKLMFKFLEVLVDCKVGRKVIVYSISSNSSRNLMYNILQCRNIINFIYCFNVNLWILFLSTKFSCAYFIVIDGLLVTHWNAFFDKISKCYEFDTKSHYFYITNMQLYRCNMDFMLC